MNKKRKDPLEDLIPKSVDRTLDDVAATLRQDSLEKFVHTTLRQTLAPKAPRTLEQRVLAELSRQASRPWWQQSFGHWPVVPRLLFLVVSAGVAALVITLSVEFLRNGVAPSLSHWWSQLSTSTQALTQVASDLTSGVSKFIWFLLAGLGVAFVTALVVMLGCGAAAYRLLWKNV